MHNQSIHNTLDIIQDMLVKLGILTSFSSFKYASTTNNASHIISRYSKSLSVYFAYSCFVLKSKTIIIWLGVLKFLEITGTVTKICYLILEDKQKSDVTSYIEKPFKLQLIGNNWILQKLMYCWDSL